MDERALGGGRRCRSRLQRRGSRGFGRSDRRARTLLNRNESGPGHANNLGNCALTNLHTSPSDAQAATDFLCSQIVQISHRELPLSII